MAAAALYLVITTITWRAHPELLGLVARSPLVWLLLLLMAGATVVVPVAVRIARFRTAFTASAVMIGSMMGLAAAGLFPRLVPSLTDAAYSLTIFNSSSTPRTLALMLGIALLGMPPVIAYTAIIYRAFRGKVVLTADSY